MRATKFNLQIISFLIGFISCATFGILLFFEASYFNLIGLVFSLHWIIQQLEINMLDFKNRTSYLFLTLSLFFSSTIFFNLNRDWLLYSWKYQLVLFVMILFTYWYYKLSITQNVILSSISFIFLFFYGSFLCILIAKNIELEFYFNIAQGYTIFLLALGIFLSIKNQFKKVP
jgi:hypothetical protein